MARRGIRPAHVADWLALVGDAADGYPGIPGIGEKSATALLQAFGRLEAIPRDPAAWPAAIRGRERLAATLAEQMQDALLYRKLATLIVDVPLTESLDDLRWRGVSQELFEPWCESVGAGRLRERAAQSTIAP
jgi:5'-3' exonuclease